MRIAGYISLFFFCLVTTVYAADVAKIGVFDIQKILSTSEAGKKGKLDIESQGKKMEETLKKEGGIIEQFKSQLERESMVLSKEQFETKEREYRIKVNDFKSKQKKFMADFKELEARLVKKIMGDVFDLVENIGKKEGYLLILEKREAGIVYFPDSIDMTDRLIKEYNAQIAAGKAK